MVFIVIALCWHVFAYIFFFKIKYKEYYSILDIGKKN